MRENKNRAAGAARHSSSLAGLAAATTTAAATIATADDQLFIMFEMHREFSFRGDKIDVYLCEV